MNSFLKNSAQGNNWHKDCLLAANRQLERQYKQSPSPCIALLISRNYRLLLTQQEHPKIKQRWRTQSQYWWQSYCRSNQRNSSLSLFSNFYID